MINRDILWLYPKMEEFSIRWHKEKRCSCMKYFEKDITGDNYMPCEHLKDALWKEFRVTIDAIEDDFRERMAKKLHSLTKR